MERVIGRLDYPRLENQIKFHFKKDLYAAITRLGFEMVSECVAKLYYGQGLTCYGIAKLIPVHPNTVNRWMAAWGMPRRDYNNVGNPWTYPKHCRACGTETVPGYRAVGHCWPCYMKEKIHGRLTSSLPLQGD